MELQEFLSCLATKTGATPKKSGEGYSSRCPAHDDQQPSLSVTQDNDGKILIHCFAGCNGEAICASLGLTVAALFNESSNNRETPKRTIYSYIDEAYKELYRKIRIEPGFDGKSKSFYSERQDENGKIICNLKGCRKVLYRLPDVIKGLAEGQPIFLVEGEKDADKLAGYNLIATTSLDSLKWEDGFTQTLKHADIIILYDMDATGVKRKDALCARLYKKVKRLRVVDLPGLIYQASHGHDISDWLAMGHTVAELLELVNKTPDYAPANNGLRVVTLNEFLRIELPKREMLLAPFLPSQGLAMIYAKRGIGKTHIAIGIASAVARGGTFLKWTALHPHKVLFIDGEMPGAAIQERLKRIAITDELNEQAQGNLRLITPDLQDCPMPDLSTKVGRDAIEAFVDECDLVIIDNISSLFRSGIENEADSWQPIQDWALNMRRKGKSVLFIHHAGKGGNQRGTSKKEDILDAVVKLEHPTDYRPDQGARFDVLYEKTRHFAGESATPFQVHLREDTHDGLWYWDVLDIQADPNVVAVAELSNQGLTIAQIRQKMELTKSQVETCKKKARELGLMG